MSDWIKKYWEYIDTSTQNLIRKEVNEYIDSERNKGDDCDRLTWEKFARWLNQTTVSFVVGDDVVLVRNSYPSPVTEVGVVYLAKKDYYVVLRSNGTTVSVALDGSILRWEDGSYMRKMKSDEKFMNIKEVGQMLKNLGFDTGDIDKALESDDEAIHRLKSAILKRLSSDADI
jgi:hypothetical protein